MNGACSSWGFLWSEEWGASAAWGDRDTIEPNSEYAAIGPGCLDTLRTADTRIWEQFRNEAAAATWSDGIGAVLGLAWADIERAASMVGPERYVATARGVHLNEVGAAVDRPRGSLTEDADYRLAIIVDAATLYSSGTPEQVLELARRLVTGIAGIGDLDFQELYPAAFRLRIGDMDAAIFNLLADILEDVPPAGVGATLATYFTGVQGTFGSASGPVASPAGFGSIHGPTATRHPFGSSRGI